MTSGFQHYQEKGYAVFPERIPKSLIRETADYLGGEMQACLLKIQEDTGIRDFAQWVETIERLKSEGRLEQLSHETRNILCGHFRLETRLSEQLKKVAQTPTMLELARSLLGPGTLGLHMPPAARFVLPGNPYVGVPAHQDISYNRHLGSFVTIWTPMVEIDTDCGGVTFFEGEQPEIPDEDPTTGDFWLNPVSVEGLVPKACTLSQGDVLALNPRVVHQSSPNRSRRVRISVDYRFFLVDGPAEKHYLDLATGEIVAPQSA